MTETMRSRSRNWTEGSATVEFALIFPLLVLMCMGATDFGRLFYHGVTVAHAAASGAFFGARNNITSGDFVGMQQMVNDDAVNIPAVSATAQRYCDCPNAPADGPGSTDAVDCITATCTGYGLPRVYVKTLVQQQFETVGKYPGIPETVNVSRNAYMRVQ